MAGVGIAVFGAAILRVSPDEKTDPVEADTIGLTRNGAESTFDASWLDVPGDQYGGDDGPPIDVQYLGETGRIRFELTKWDSATVDRIYGRLVGGAAGVQEQPGTLVFSGGKSRIVDIVGFSETIRFHVAFPRAPIQLNYATKFSTLVCEFEVHGDQSSPTTNKIYSRITAGHAGFIPPMVDTP